MSSDIAISVKNIGKCYEMYAKPYHRLFQTLTRGRRQFYKAFWALQDINFEVKKGECVGIIGRNGCGKSTLLQIIAGTLQPTTGSVEVRGRVAALLELGSGFNPEFTGRENVYMNGTVLGLSHKEIDEKFDEIVAFADIGEFIDQPVKTYSSGMMMRLAFAVAVNVTPDILIVDEALAVGDGAFVHKCMSRIQKMLDSGTSLVLVTHDIETVKRFCKHGVWLNNGKIQSLGPAGVTGDKYYAFLRTGSAESVDAQQIAAIREEKAIVTEFPLFKVSKEIDLSDDRLFLESPWKWGDTNGVYGKGRVGQKDQKATFCFSGTELELAFGRGEEYGDPKIIIDGLERPYNSFLEWNLNGDKRVSVLRFSLVPGDHEVRIVTPDNNLPVWWLSGRTKNAGTIPEFRVDPNFKEDPTGCGRHGNGKGRIVAAELVDAETGNPISSVKFRQRFRIEVWAECLTDNLPLRIGFGAHIKDKNQNWIFGTSNWDARLQADSNAKYWHISFEYENLLPSGDYGILLAMAESGGNLDTAIHMDVIETALMFKSVWTSDHPHVHGSIHQPVFITVDSYEKKHCEEI